MEFEFLNLETCHTATDLAVVIDVLRAFSTAAYAFNAGAKEILPVAGVDEALSLRDRIPQSLVMGESGGKPVPGFDLDNSPMLDGRDVKGRTIIHRSSAGTQGIVRAAGARVVLAASFVIATATSQRIKALKPSRVSFVITGNHEGMDGDEDRACADYLMLLLSEKKPPFEPFRQRVRQSTAGQRFIDPHFSELPEVDLELCLKVDCFHFSMQIDRKADPLALRSVNNQGVPFSRNG